MEKDFDAKKEKEERQDKENAEVASEQEKTHEEQDVVNDEAGDLKEEESEYDKLKKEYDELHDKYLRLYSEFENFRRRTNKEKIDLIDTANERLLLEILPVVDDFERAMDSMQEAQEVSSVCEGVSLIFNKMKRTLETSGLSEIDCIGEDFDPEIHEAVTKIPAPKKKLKGKIVDQIQKGYKLRSKVIRYSKVVVGE